MPVLKSVHNLPIQITLQVTVKSVLTPVRGVIATGLAMNAV